MSLSIGIVGLPNVGKSTLFNALADANALAANYPFATIEPNKGIVSVPDSKLDELAALYKPKSVVPATVTFIDIAGLVKGASKGEGLGNQFLANIRSTNAICHVVKAFSESTETIKSSPKDDIEVINTELILADLQTLDSRMPRVEKEARIDIKLKPMLDSLNLLKTSLESGKLASHLHELNEGYIEDLHLLTVKPQIYTFNLDEKGLNDNRLKSQLTDLTAPSKALFINAKIESELRSLDQADKVELLASYGQAESGLNQLIHLAYEILGLQSYYTAGEKEVRAWTINKGSTAPQAAGVIHSDFERGFIAAQVVNFSDLIETGSLNVAKAAGKVRTEGKDYIVQPDDVIEFRFNV